MLPEAAGVNGIVARRGVGQERLGLAWDSVAGVCRVRDNDV
jgi:hypothetical protein